MGVDGNKKVWQSDGKTVTDKSIPAWALKFMGQTEEGFRSMLSRIQDNISLESIRATWNVGLNLYRTESSALLTEHFYDKATENAVNGIEWTPRKEGLEPIFEMKS